MHETVAILCLLLSVIGSGADGAAGEVAPHRVLAPGMWHKISDGEPVTTEHLAEGAYLVLKDDGKGTTSFQVALVKGDDVLAKLTRFQKVTGMKSGKGAAIFNIEQIETDQWITPRGGSENHVANKIQDGREGEKSQFRFVDIHVFLQAGTPHNATSPAELGFLIMASSSSQ